MHFPLWRYLNQPFCDSACPPVFNPSKYWRRYKVSQLDRCLCNAFLEQCWNACYQTFVVRHRDFCIRNPLEEDPIWLIERCWNLARRNRYYEHPENHILERES